MAVKSPDIYALNAVTEKLFPQTSPEVQEEICLKSFEDEPEVTTEERESQCDPSTIPDLRESAFEALDPHTSSYGRPNYEKVNAAIKLARFGEPDAAKDLILTPMYEARCVMGFNSGHHPDNLDSSATMWKLYRALDEDALPVISEVALLSRCDPKYDEVTSDTIVFDAYGVREDAREILIDYATEFVLGE